MNDFGFGTNFVTYLNVLFHLVVLLIFGGN